MSVVPRAGALNRTRGCRRYLLLGVAAISARRHNERIAHAHAATGSAHLIFDRRQHSACCARNKHLRPALAYQGHAAAVIRDATLAAIMLVLMLSLLVWAAVDKWREDRQ